MPTTSRLRGARETFRAHARANRVAHRLHCRPSAANTQTKKESVMQQEFSSIDHEALSLVTGGDNTWRTQVGVQVKGTNIGATVEESKNNYRDCLDAVGKYGGKVSECKYVLEGNK
jgi:hypothetical protein